MGALFAFVDGDRPMRPTRHFVGLPAELAGGTPPSPLPHAAVVVLVDRADGPLLYRYTAGGEDAGDIWHETIEDAKAQAEDEYGNALGAWQQVPTGIADPRTYALDAVAGRAEP